MTDTDRMVAAERERDRLRASLERFGRHDDGCPAGVRGAFGQRCVCGLHAALAFHAVAFEGTES